MLDKIKPKSEFNRSVLTLMTGTVIAQVIPIIISPLLTRIYTPQDFGVFALYMAIVSMLAVVATGRYELAIMLPKKDEEAASLIALSMLLVVLFSTFVFILLLFLSKPLSLLVKTPDIAIWLYLAPLSIFFIGLYQNLNLWVNRNKQYKRQAIGKVVQNGVIGCVSIIAGMIGYSRGGLILGLILGQGAAAFFLAYFTYKYDGSIFKKVDKNTVKLLAKKYIDFPKFDILASLSSVSSQQVINILFNTLFNSAVAGYFYLTQRMLSAPITFLASAVLDVFKQTAAKEYEKYGNAKYIYISTFKKLLLLSLLPTILIYLYSVDIFIFMFGEQWEEAGKYAQILSPMLFFRFMANPLSFMLYIGNKQNVNLYMQLALLICILFIFYLSSSAKEIVVLLSIVFSVFYILNIAISAHIARVFERYP